MGNVLFEVVTKCGLLLIGLALVAAWINAGCPFVTITRK